MDAAQKYILKNWLNAVISTLFTPLFPSVALAQALVETRAGNSSLTKQYNNHFGIKSFGWRGKSINLSTREVFNGKDTQINSNFRVYRTGLQSYRDRVKFLNKYPNYKRAGVFVATTPEQQISALKLAGYATGTYYVDALTQRLNKYNLKRFDTVKRVFEIAIIIGLLFGMYNAYRYRTQIKTKIVTTYNELKNKMQG